MNPAPPFSAWERGIAVRYLRAKRSQGGVALISIIAFVGITLAVAVLIIVMSVMNGFRSELSGKILGFRGHADVYGAPPGDVDRAPMVKRLRAVPGVVSAIAVNDAEALAQGQDVPRGVAVRGISRDDLTRLKIVADSIKPSNALAGFDQGEDGGDELIVGRRLAENLGVKTGDSLTLTSPSSGATAFGALPTRKTYTVGGTFSVGMSEFDQLYIYMPLKQSQLFFGTDAATLLVEIKLDNPDKVLALDPQLELAAGPGTKVIDWTENNQAFFNALQIERNVMGLILACLVLIAAMNIISGLIMLVKNKGRDIAILRTMGASRGAILRIFLMAGATIGVLGTFSGLLISVAFCANIEAIQTFVEHVTGRTVFSADVYFLSHVPAKIDWSEVLVVAVGSTLASFIASVFPAWQASRLDPVEALRYE